VIIGLDAADIIAQQKTLFTIITVSNDCAEGCQEGSGSQIYSAGCL